MGVLHNNQYHTLFYRLKLITVLEKFLLGIHLSIKSKEVNMYNQEKCHYCKKGEQQANLLGEIR